MKKQLMAGMMAASMALSLAACGGYLIHLILKIRIFIMIMFIYLKKSYKSI